MTGDQATNRWTLLEKGSEVCAVCAAAWADINPLIAELNAAGPAPSNAVIVINPDWSEVGPMTQTVCGNNVNGEFCTSPPSRRRIEIVLGPLPSGNANLRTKCERCLAREFPVVDAIIRVHLGMPAAEPEPAPAPPKPPTREEVQATKQHSIQVKIAEAIEQHSYAHKRPLTSMESAAQIIDAVREIIAMEADRNKVFVRHEGDQVVATTRGVTVRLPRGR